MTRLMAAAVVAAAGLSSSTGFAAEPGAPRPDLTASLDAAALEISPRVIEWRRDFHRHPELSNREVRTARVVAAHLESLGMRVRTGVARTGVVGVLQGGRPGPAVALRADMDALPVTEQVDLPFASTALGEFQGQQVGVMHACGHDGHVAILMGAAEILARERDRLSGTIVFLFQPAEEGPPEGEEGGASLMMKEGALSDPRPRAIFGLHVTPLFEVGKIATRAGGILASSDRMKIRVHGKQTHAARPWGGIDPIATAAQIVLGLQLIASRQIDLTEAPAVVSIGSIQGGVRFNIIPDDVEMVGTIRTLDSGMQQEIHRRVVRTAEEIAASAGASAEVTFQSMCPVTSNDPGLLAAMAPTLERVAGEGNVDFQMKPWLGAEDFAFYQEEVPGLYFALGVRTPGADPEGFPSNHSPRFRMDEDALVLGVRAMAHLAVDALRMHH